MKTISGIEFASEHNGTDVFRLIELAYEQGQKDGHSEQLGTNLAEVGTDCMRLIRNFIKMTPSVRQEPDRPGSNVPKQPTVPPMPKGDPDRTGYKMYPDYMTVWKYLHQLPPAQPEIIRCKDCKYWVPGYITDNDDFIPPKCGEWQQMVGHSSDDYCSLAERREVTE